MSNILKVAIGQHSDKGAKEINQDFHGAVVPKEPQLGSKGIAVALADGISSSPVSQHASQMAVAGFLEDYYCTSDAWSVKLSAQRVLHATNSWLFSQTRQSQYRFDKDKGYVCTFSGIVFKAAMAYLFHVGDARIYRIRDGALEQLTADHRYWLSSEESYLSRAMGISQQVDIDYLSMPLERGDVYVLATDGVYEHVLPQFFVEAIHLSGNDLDGAARAIVEEAMALGSTDNLTIQIVRVDDLPRRDAEGTYRQFSELPFPPELDARMEFDGYRIIRKIHASSRSHAFLAVDGETGEQVVIKTPSTEHREDPAYLERFLMEEWIARRINSAHVLKPCTLTRKRNYQYVAMEYVEGQTLAQWMRDNPRPDLESVRGIVEQVATGLQAFHRMEMLHQDLRPENIMIDSAGTVKIIDFGATRVAGLAEAEATDELSPILGTEQYSAPEYFLGEEGSSRSDIFSLGVIAYQMLTGKLPYGASVPRARSVAAQRKLVYAPARDEERRVPAWVDEALRKAVHPDPFKRYEEVSEFVYDLRHPNREFISRNRPALMERNPVGFWKAVSLLLFLLLIVAVFKLHAAG